MRKLFLLLFVSLAVVFVNGQINLVNDGYFVNTGMTNTIGPDGAYPGMNYWYPHLLTDNQNTVYITSDSELNDRNAVGIKVQSTNSSNWTCGLAQRLSAPDNGVYRVGFWGKIVAGTSPYIRVFIRIDDTHSENAPAKTGSKYFVRDGSSNRISSDIFFTSAWKYYTVDFDLSKKATKDSYTESETTDVSDIQDFSLYFSNFIAAKEGDLLITGVTMTKVDNSDTPSDWYNPGFEEPFAVPYLLLNAAGNPVRAQETTTKGIWVLSLMDGISDETKSKAMVLVDSTESYSGERSMKLDVKYVKDFSKVYLATTLFDLPKDNYILSFYLKSNVDEAPFRIDVDNYNIEKASAQAGFPFSDAATIREYRTATTDWTKYEVEFNNSEMSDTLAIAIRPNLLSTGLPGDWSERGATYWFDDFSIVKNNLSDMNNVLRKEMLDVIVTGNSITVYNVEAAVEMIDLNGRVIDKKMPVDNQLHFNVLNGGIYLVRSGGINKKVVVK